MPQTLSLECYNLYFSDSSPIDITLLKNVIKKNKNLKLESKEEQLTLLTFDDKQSKWWPLLWINKRNAYINAEPIFNLGLYYNLVNIAESVNACIISEEGLLLFIPQYGLLYDPEGKEDLEIEIGELHIEIVKSGNLNLAIKNIISNRQKRNGKTLNQKTKKDKAFEKFESKQHYIAIVLFAILIIFLLIKKFG